MANGTNGNGGKKPKLTMKDMDRMRSTLAVDVARSTRAATGTLWRMDIDGLVDILGQPFDVTKIPLHKLHQMRRDPMIAFALLFCKVPLVRASWYMKSENAQAAAFADNALRRIYSRFIFQYANSLDFGYSAIVKRFEFDRPDWTYIDHKKGTGKEVPVWDEVLPALVWKPFQALPPDNVEPDWNKDGEFNGIRTREVETVRRFPGQGPAQKKDPEVPLEKSLWVTNEKDSVFGSLWGFPRIAYAYRYWWSYWYRWALSDRHFEKDADPALKIYYPLIEGVNDDGEEVNYAELALELGERLRSGANVALPSSLIKSEMDDKPTQHREWEMEFLTGGGNFAAFQETFAYLDIAKIRSIMVPEQAFFEGRGGTSSRNVAEQLGDVFFESQAVLMSEIDDHLNRFVIPQLVEANFGPNVRVEKVTRGFAQQDVELAKQIITLIGQADANQLEVDTREILDQMGIPLMTPAEVKKKQEELAAQMAPPEGPPGFPPGGGFGPPQVPAIAGKQAGVNQWGFYYTAPERIDLSEPKKLPPTRHYEDDEIRDLMSSMQNDWRQYWATQYNDFADFVAKQDLFLAEDDPADPTAPKKTGAAMTARQILDKWLQTPEQLAAISRRVAGFLRSIMDKAGKRELARVRVADVEWDQDRPEVVAWSAKRAADLVKNVSENTRKELRKFLTAEIDKTQSPVDIADRIRSHFGEWPGWKADRVARTETMMAYNQAALLSYKAAGVKRVKAHDAAVREQSDPECIARDGKVYTLAQAFKEQDKEHPNGTLFWSPVMNLNPLTLSIEYVTDFVFEGQPAVGYYDDTEQKMYLDEHVSDADAELLFMAAGEAILPALEEPRWDEERVLRDLRGRFAKHGESRLSARKAMEELERSGFIPKLRRRVTDAVVGEGLSLQERKHRKQFIDTLFQLVREDPGYALPFLGAVTETLREAHPQDDLEVMMSEAAPPMETRYERARLIDSPAPVPALAPVPAPASEPVVNIAVAGVTLAEVENAIAPVRARLDGFSDAITSALQGIPAANVVVEAAPTPEVHMAAPEVTVNTPEVTVNMPEVRNEIIVTPAPQPPPRKIKRNLIRDEKGMVTGIEEVEE